MKIKNFVVEPREIYAKIYQGDNEELLLKIYGWSIVEEDDNTFITPVVGSGGFLSPIDEEVNNKSTWYDSNCFYDKKGNNIDWININGAK